MRGLLKVPAKPGAYVGKLIESLDWRIDDSGQDDEHISSEAPTFSRSGDAIGKFRFFLGQRDAAERPADGDLVACWCRQVAGDRPPEMDFEESGRGAAEGDEHRTGVAMRLRIRSVGSCGGRTQVSGDIIRWEGPEPAGLVCG